MKKIPFTEEDYNWIDDNRESLREDEKKHIVEQKRIMGTNDAIISSFPKELETVMQLLIDAWREADRGNLLIPLVKHRSIFGQRYSWFWDNL